MAKTNEIESAKLILEKERKERGEKAAKALETWAKEFNVQLVPVIQIGDKTAPIQGLIKPQVSFEIHAL